MPNTLAHLGLQSVVTRRLIRQADLKWIYLGCVVPDVPWILLRLVKFVAPHAWIFDLRLIAIIQSSLLFSLCLSGALAVWSVRPWKTFSILALGSLLHLLIDATQMKWGNGVHLFAPISWDLANFGWYWPEEVPTLLLSVFGLVFVLYAWRMMPIVGSDLCLPRGRALIVGVLCLLIFLASPPLFFSGPLIADNHSIETLKEKKIRPGRAVEFDRRPYSKGPAGDLIVDFAGQDIRLIAMPDIPPNIVSLKGKFVDAETVRVEALHVHAGRLRDLPSYLGLAWICFIWITALRHRLMAHQSHSP